MSASLCIGLSFESNFKEELNCTRLIIKVDENQLATLWEYKLVSLKKPRLTGEAPSESETENQAGGRLSWGCDRLTAHVNPIFYAWYNHSVSMAGSRTKAISYHIMLPASQSSVPGD